MEGVSRLRSCRNNPSSGFVPLAASSIRLLVVEEMLRGGEWP